AAGLGGGDGVNGQRPVVVGHQIDGMTEGGRVCQQWRDVLEQDARLRKVGDVADVSFQVHAGLPSMGKAAAGLIGRIGPMGPIGLISATVAFPHGARYRVLSSEATMPLTIRRGVLDDTAIVADMNSRM